MCSLSQSRKTFLQTPSCCHMHAKCSTISIAGLSTLCYQWQFAAKKPYLILKAGAKLFSKVLQFAFDVPAQLIYYVLLLPNGISRSTLYSAYMKFSQSKCDNQFAGKSKRGQLTNERDSGLQVWKLIRNDSLCKPIGFCFLGLPSLFTYTYLLGYASHLGRF